MGCPAGECVTGRAWFPRSESTLVDLDSFERLKVIGRGSFGKVRVYVHARSHCGLLLLLRLVYSSLFCFLPSA